MKIRHMAAEDRADALHAYRWAKKEQFLFDTLYAAEDPRHTARRRGIFFVTQETTIGQLTAALADARSKRDVVRWSALIVPDDFFAEAEAYGQPS